MRNGPLAISAGKWYSGINSLQNVAYITVFHIMKINRMIPFCNVFMTWLLHINWPVVLTTYML